MTLDTLLRLSRITGCYPDKEHTMNPMIKKTLTVVTSMVLAACQPHVEPTALSFQQLQGIPTEEPGLLKGVSALYAGILSDHLLIAGGCNFPDVPVADGGKKVYYQGIYMAPLTADTCLHWKRVGTFPQAAAYGVSVTTDEGIVCVGGNTAERSLSDVYLLHAQADGLRIDTLPALPVTMDNMGGALLGHTLYVVGGNVNGVPSSNMYSLNLSAYTEGWKQEPALPGPPRTQPVCVAQGGKLYVWGGFAPASAGREASLSVDGYAYTPDTQEWKSVATPCAAGNEISLGGGMGAADGEGAILCAGGVNKDIFLKALQGEYSGKVYLSHPAVWYRFNRNFLRYDVPTDTWTSLGEFEQGARAGAVMVSHGKAHYIIQGELKPGIRTTEINRVTTNKNKL